jgi:hypothetical protein
MTTEHVDLLKDAIIAEVASDVLKLRDQVQAVNDDLLLVGPLVSQLKDSFPGHFDALQAGLIETLDQINEGIKEAGGERIDFVRGQLHVFIEQAINKAFESNSKRVEQLTQAFTEQNNAAALNLRSQFDEVSGGMKAMRVEMSRLKFPTWAKIAIPLAFIAAIGCTAVATYQFAAYKEAVYMKAFVDYSKAKK